MRRQLEMFGRTRWTAEVSNEMEIEYKRQYIEAPEGWQRARSWNDIKTTMIDKELLVRRGTELVPRIMTAVSGDKKGCYAMFRGDGGTPITVSRCSDVYVPEVNEEARKKRLEELK